MNSSSSRTARDAARVTTPHLRLDVTDLGAGVSYAAGMAKMREAMAALAAKPNADAGALLLLEHKDVVTVTRSGGEAHLLASPKEFADAGIDVVETDRGGDVTFHGAGQLVGYPVIRLGPGSGLRVDLLAYVRALEDALMRVVEGFGVVGAHKKAGMTGVWVASDPHSSKDTWPDDDDAKKITAIGVGVGRGITRHGFALNVTTDLERFTSRITPCGLVGRPVTSLARELEHVPSMQDVKLACAREVARGLGLVVNHPSSSHSSVHLDDEDQAAHTACDSYDLRSTSTVLDTQVSSMTSQA